MSGCEKYVRLIQVYGILETYFCRPYTWGYKKNIYKYPENNDICMATILYEFILKWNDRQDLWCFHANIGILGVAIFPTLVQLSLLQILGAELCYLSWSEILVAEFS